LKKIRRTKHNADIKKIQGKAENSGRKEEFVVCRIVIILKLGSQDDI
jgi:hypothetical protein